MSKLLRWTSVVVGLSILGLGLFAAKLKHDLDISLRGEFNRRFNDAAAQIVELGGGNAPGQPPRERDRSLFGLAAVSERLMSFRIAAYYTQYGAVPASLEEADSHNPGRQPSPRDPWGNPFRLFSEGTDRFLIVSGGPSGTASLTAQEKEMFCTQSGGQTYLLNR